MNISSGIKAAKSVITANSPVLLLGTAIAGVVTTGVLAARAGYQARGIVDAEQARRDEEEESAPLTFQDKAKLTWLCYAVPAVTGASTIAAVTGLHTVHTKRANALAALYAVTSTKLDDVQAKAEELLGAKKTQELSNDIGQKNVDRNPLVESEVVITGTGTELMQDDWSGRYFMGSVANVEAAMNDLNRKLIEEGEVSLNDYYDLIGLPEIEMGTRFGWNGGDKPAARFGTAMSADGRPVISVWFRTKPKDNLGRY